MAWWYVKEQGQPGPVSAEKLGDLHRNGRLLADTLAWNRTLPAWWPAIESDVLNGELTWPAPWLSVVMVPLLGVFLLSGCASVLPPIARIEKGPPTLDDYSEGKSRPLIFAQCQDRVAVEIHAWTDRKQAKRFFGSDKLAYNYLPAFVEIRNLRDEAIFLDPAEMTLENGLSLSSPVVPFRVSDRLKKEILEGKRYEGHSFDPDRGVLNVDGSPAYAAPVIFVAAVWLTGGAAHSACANMGSFLDMGGMRGVIVANCFPKCLARGERLSPNEFLSPVRLAPSGRASGFLYFRRPASLGEMNVAIATDAGAPLKPFSFPLDCRSP